MADDAPIRREDRGDTELVEWKDLNREITHIWLIMNERRDHLKELLEERRKAVEAAFRVEAERMVAIAERRAASTRILVAIAAIVVPLVVALVQYLLLGAHK